MAIKKWTNAFTQECDKFLIPAYSKNIGFGLNTYLWGDEGGCERNKNNFISFRVPGATRGGIKVVDNTIVDILFDEELCFGRLGCYNPEVVEHVKTKFIGTKFDLPIIDKVGDCFGV